MNAVSRLAAGGQVLAKVTTRGELRNRAWPEREHMIAPWLRDGEAALLYAPTGIGKTMLTLTLGIAMASGGSVAGWHCPKARRVLLIDGEMNVQDLNDRLGLLEPTVDGVDRGEVDKNLFVYARNDQAAGHRFPDLATEEGRGEAFKLIAKHRAEVVVVDNLTTCCSLDDENAAASFQPILAFLGELKARRVAVIMVHHSGKTGDSYRGSSALATTFEIMVALTAPKRRTVRTGGTAFDLKFTKVRSETGEWSEPREFDLVKLEDGSRRWNAASGEDALAGKVMMALKSGLYETQGELAEACGTSASKITRIKAEWDLDGIMKAGVFEGWLSAAKAGKMAEAEDAAESVREAGREARREAGVVEREDF